MARLHGKTGAVNWSSGDITGIKSWTLDYSFDIAEGRAFDSAGAPAPVAGPYNWSGSFEGFKDGAPTAIGSSAALQLEESQTAGQLWTGTAIITGISANVSIDGLVSYTYQFTGSGALTAATA